MEYILTACGMVMGLLLLAVGATLLFLEANQSYLDVLYNKWTNREYAILREWMENTMFDWILPGVLGITLGCIMIYCLKKEKQLVTMAWVSIVVPGLLCFVSFFGSFTAVFFIITGLVILVRKTADVGE